jgi:murein DD-endopeptidase MepM/ murein hydrolase activator NlpD
MERRIDPIALAGLLLCIFMAYRLVSDRLNPEPAMAWAGTSDAASPQPPAPLGEGGGGLPFNLEQMQQVAAPYTDYTVTQGPHGFTYGHMAIDLAAGKGTPVLSPINGVVSELYIDEYGNPTLVIENELYRVTLLHGKYEVAEGQLLRLGEPVGVESNLGYTTDMQGNACKGRKKCGYHTHLNVFDKRQGRNVNPLKLIEP